MSRLPLPGHAGQYGSGVGGRHLGVAYFGARLREQLGPWRPRIEALSAGLLILVGMNQIIRAF